MVQRKIQRGRAGQVLATTGQSDPYAWHLRDMRANFKMILLPAQHGNVYTSKDPRLKAATTSPRVAHPPVRLVWRRG